MIETVFMPSSFRGGTHEHFELNFFHLMLRMIRHIVIPRPCIHNWCESGELLIYETENSVSWSLIRTILEILSLFGEFYWMLMSMVGCIMKVLFLWMRIIENVAASLPNLSLILSFPPVRTLLFRQDFSVILTLTPIPTNQATGKCVFPALIIDAI